MSKSNPDSSVSKLGETTAGAMSSWTPGTGTIATVITTITMRAISCSMQTSTIRTDPRIWPTTMKDPNSPIECATHSTPSSRS
jgi:hypothetical protein